MISIKSAFYLILMYWMFFIFKMNAKMEHINVTKLQHVPTQLVLTTVPVQVDIHQKTKEVALVRACIFLCFFKILSGFLKTLQRFVRA